MQGANINSVSVSDYAKLKSFTMAAYGVTPQVFETPGNDFLDIYY